MKTSDMIRQLCDQMNISVSELARRLGQSPQNFGKKLKRETITLEELKSIAEVMDVKFEQTFILPDGKEIKAESFLYTVKCRRELTKRCTSGTFR